MLASRLFIFLNKCLKHNQIRNVRMHTYSHINYVTWFDHNIPLHPVSSGALCLGALTQQHQVGVVPPRSRVGKFKYSSVWKCSQSPLHTLMPRNGRGPPPLTWSGHFVSTCFCLIWDSLNDLPFVVALTFLQNTAVKPKQVTMGSKCQL